MAKLKYRLPGVLTQDCSTARGCKHCLPFFKKGLASTWDSLHGEELTTWEVDSCLKYTRAPITLAGTAFVVKEQLSFLLCKTVPLRRPHSSNLLGVTPQLVSKKNMSP
jgi:hypothetical protein